MISRSWTIALLLAMTVSLPRPSQARAAVTVTDASSLEDRADAFFRAVRRTNADSIAVFFPREADWTYVHTAHHRDGDRTAIRRFRGAESLAAIRFRGPLWASFEIQYESQPIGLFAHQVMHRGTAWRRVRGNRFVPPGAAASSPIFVEWRREGGQWVIAAFGDESFPSGETPSWCC